MLQSPEMLLLRLLRAPRVAGFARAAGGLAVAGLVACGPSFQVIYEGDARFEHCYALDELPQISMDEKSECWSQWTKSYTYGQTRNRVDYATMRAKALREVPAAPTDEALMSAAPGEGTGRAVGHDEPATTNAFAPPPTTMSDVDGGAAQAGGTGMDQIHVPGTTPASAPPPPREPCTDRCRSEWGTCKGACRAKGCVACDTSYGGCMKRCF